LLARGLQLPLTIILPRTNRTEFRSADYRPLTSPFVVKPAKGGGGFGVLVGATRPDEVVQTASSFATNVSRPAAHRTTNHRWPARLVPRLQRVRTNHSVLVDDTTHKYASSRPATAAS